MLRKIRIVAATICFTLITLLFLDFTGTLHLWFVPPGRIGFERRSRRIPRYPHFIVRTCLLLGNLSARCIPRYRFVDIG